MQLSNGLSNPAGLWLGHLLFDGLFSTLLTTIIIIIFAVASNQFHGLGYFVRLFPSHADRISFSFIVAYSSVACDDSLWIRFRAVRVLRHTVHCVTSGGFCSGGGVSSSYVYCEC
jgi:hypothetical protein